MALEGSGRNAVHIEYSSSYSYFDPTCTHRVPIVASRHRCIAKPLPNQVNAGDARAWPPTPFAAVQQTRANELPAPCTDTLPHSEAEPISYLPPLHFPVWPARATARDARSLTCQSLHTNHTTCVLPPSRCAATCASPPPDHQPEPANVRVRTVARPTAQSLLWESPFLVWVISAATSKTEALHIRDFD